MTINPFIIGAKSFRTLKDGYLWRDKFVGNSDQRNPLTLTPRNKYHSTVKSICKY